MQNKQRYQTANSYFQTKIDFDHQNYWSITPQKYQQLSKLKLKYMLYNYLL